MNSAKSLSDPQSKAKVMNMKIPMLNNAKRCCWLLFLLAAGFLTTGRAQTSQYMSYQGYLTDGNGNALGSTNTGPKAYDVVFRIWDAATGGTEWFSELQTVTVDNGYFSVLLGQGTAYSSEPTLHVPLGNVFSNSAALSRYVEMTVLGIGSSGFITILPRLQLVSSPFAFQAANALNVTGTNVITAANFATNLGVWQASGASIYHTGGNVGIGVTGPTANLQVAATSGYPTPGISLIGSVGDMELSLQNTSSAGHNYALLSSGTGSGVPSALRFYDATTGNDRLDILASGNVGIGTSSPSQLLEVNGAAQANGLFSGNGGIYVNSTNGYHQSSLGAFNVDAPNVVGGRLTVTTSGNVGIGTSTPTQASLVVGTESGFLALNSYGLLDSVQTFFGNDNGGDLFNAIYASGYISTASGFVVYSDERIKRITGRSDSARDLATLQGIQVTDYTYIDPIAHGPGKFKKVIAQQVEKVYPQAVSKTTDVVPDIFKMAAIEDGWVTLATDLKKGERVRLIGDKQEGIHEVLEVADGKFRTDFKPAGHEVFVYGREVKDFRSVDYDAISMLNVSATQELAKRLEKLETSEARVAELEQKAAKVEALEQQLADLKKTVAQLVEAGKNAKIASASAQTQTAQPASFTASGLEH